MKKFRRKLRSLFAGDESLSKAQTSSHALASSEAFSSPQAEISPRALKPSQAPTFAYKRLNEDVREFRLVELLPHADFATPIRIRLFNTTLSKPPSYEALSYVWGDPNVTVPILNENGTLQFNVTTNLELALRYLRLDRETRQMWIDALCINQHDIEERNGQVRQMRKIYLSARQVVVWLGEIGSAPKALALLSKINKYRYLDVTNEGPALEACRELFSRPWWTRTWILQEVLHDKPVQVYIGNLSVTLDELCNYFDSYLPVIFQQVKSKEGRQDQAFDSFFKDYMDLIKANTVNETIVVKMFSIRRSVSPKTKLSLPFINTLNRFRSQKCSDPRDKVYALLGLSDAAKDIEVNYDVSKSTVYTNAMKLFSPVVMTESLLMVECPEREIGRTENLPSWVPDWTLQQSEFPSFIRLYSSNFNAGRGKENPESTYTSTFDGDALLLKGIYIGIIIGVRGAYDYRNIYAPGEENTAKIFTYDVHTALRSETTIQPQELEPSRTLRNTSWGPIQTEIGDIVVVIAGSPVPFVLRRHEDAYLLVGGCWIIDSELQQSRVNPNNIHEDPGLSTIMHGSAWDEAKIETFRIV